MWTQKTRSGAILPEVKVRTPDRRGGIRVTYPKILGHSAGQGPLADVVACTLTGSSAFRTEVETEQDSPRGVIRPELR
jgi:hypothetical protein